MQTRRDHIQAYQFAVGRLATALLTGDPGRGTGPTRRGTLGTYFGLLLVVLLCVGFGVYGLIKPVQKDTWRQPGSIIVEKETGSRYIMVGGTLRPVFNYASALLLTGSSGTVRTVSRDVLSKVPHGGPVGIPGAPDSLPTPADILAGGWARCLRPRVPGEVLDLAPAHTSRVPSGAQALLTSRNGDRFVLYQGVKYPVPHPSALIALGLDGGRQLSAPDSWLARLPTGTALAAPTVPHAGRSAGTVAGREVKVGQLFRTPADAGSHTYVMLDNGVAPVTATQSALLAAQPGAGAVYTVDATAIAASPASPTGLPSRGMPDLLNAPQAVRTLATALCLRQIPSGPKLTTQVVLESGTAATTTRQVLIPPGHGVLVLDQNQLEAGDHNPQTYLVDDRGVLYPLGDSGAAPALRLSGPSTPMPEDVMALLTRGPVLDATAAAAAPTVSGLSSGPNGKGEAKSSASAPSAPENVTGSSYEERGRDNAVTATYIGGSLGSVGASPAGDTANAAAAEAGWTTGSGIQGKDGQRR